MNVYQTILSLYIEILMPTLEIVHYANKKYGLKLIQSLKDISEVPDVKG